MEKNATRDFKLPFAQSGYYFLISAFWVLFALSSKVQTRIWLICVCFRVGGNFSEPILYINFLWRRDVN